MRKIHSLGVAGALAVVAALAGPAANLAAMEQTVESDRFRALASGEALDLHVLGRRVNFGLASTGATADAVAKTLDLKASGIGTLLSPKTAVEAVLPSAPPEGLRSCFAPPLGELLAGIGLPQLIVGEVACGQAKVIGDISNFESLGVGEVANLRVNATQVLKPVLDSLAPAIETVRATPVGELLTRTDEVSQTAIATLNGLFGQLLGEGTLLLPDLLPGQTVGELVSRLGDSDLVRLDIGDAVARTVSNGATLTASSVAKAGTIEILPALKGVGTAPLLRIVTGDSESSVVYDRNSTAGSGAAKNTLVRIESELLPQVLADKLGLLGVTPLADLAAKLGYKSTQGALELAPGQSVDLFCEGPVAPLCSTVSVGLPKETKLPDGGLRVEAASVSVHLFKNLNSLVPGVNLGTLLGDTAIEGLLKPVTDATGLRLGEVSGVPGIKLDLAKTLAEVAGTKVLGMAGEAPREIGPVAATLPRTGGTPLTGAPLLVPGLFGASAALRSLLRRRHG